MRIRFPPYFSIFSYNSPVVDLEFFFSNYNGGSQLQLYPLNVAILQNVQKIQKTSFVLVQFDFFPTTLVEKRGSRKQSKDSAVGLAFKNILECIY